MESRNHKLKIIALSLLVIALTEVQFDNLYLVVDSSKVGKSFLCLKYFFFFPKFWVGNVAFDF